jgi:hypothetical protein
MWVEYLIPPGQVLREWELSYPQEQLPGRAPAGRGSEELHNPPTQDQSSFYSESAISSITNLGWLFHV